ncbi:MULTISPECIES: YfhO family protein [Lactobacillaceae]|uniref:YfhO family protein n=1 Tax=Lactobacillaceae TaxID=33958 RepID=UPI0014568B04|nr:YfhO family protein [Lactobacillus sp. HBUAS51381]NLR10172.1 YfhO family protein [Lactobacillus sp. HBUAS51381]
MRRERIRFNHWRLPVLAGLLALGVLTFLFAVRGVTPFGDHNLLIGDLGTQYVPFFTDFTRLIRGHTLDLYNFHQAFGGSWVPVVAYYLLSPFNVLLVFFKASQIPVAMAIIILLKITTMAGTMTFYLQEHWRTQRPFVAVFGLAYAFSGFVALNFFNLMWLDALIFLPLITWGLDRLVISGRTGGYFCWLLISVLTDYYLGYMTCLFVVGYFLYIVTAEWPAGQSIREWWRVKQETCYRFVAASLLSVGSTLVVLLPTVLSMLETPKTQSQAGNFHLVPTFGLEFFSQLGVGSANYLQRLDHGPAIFASSLVVLLAVAYFGLPQVKGWAKVRVAGLLAFLFLGMWLRGFNTIWHLMTPPAGYPFRNSFFFSFVLILIASSAWHAGIAQLPRRWRWGIPLGLGSLMLLGSVLIPQMQTLTQSSYYASLQPLNWSAIITSLVLLAVTAGLLWVGKVRPLWLGIIVILEVTINFSFALVGVDYGSQRRYAQAYDQSVKRLRPVTAAKTLYRIRNNTPTVAPGFHGHYNPYNDGMWLGYNGSTAYSSTISANTISMAKNLGIYTRNERRLSHQGFTPVTEMLFGIHQKLTKTGAVTVGSYSGMGFAVGPRFTNLKLSSNAIENQEAVLQALRPSRQAYFVPISAGHDQVKAIWRINHHPTNFVYNHVWHVTPQATGRLYLFDPTSSSKYSTMQVNGQSVAPKMMADGNTSLINLGEYQRGQALTIKYASNRPTPKSLTVATLPASRMAAVHRSVSEYQLRLRRHQGHLHTDYQGMLTAPVTKRWVYLSLPQEQGWRITVNDQPVKPRTVLGDMVAVPVIPGKNHVVVSYRVPGSRIGLAVTLLSGAIYGIFWFRKRL